MADGCRVECRQMLIYPYCMKIFGTKMQNDHVEMSMWPEMEPEVNSHDVISRTSRCQSFSAIIRYIWTKFSQELKKQTTIVAERAKFTVHENPRWISRKSVNISGLHEDRLFLTNLLERCITSKKTGSLLAWRHYRLSAHMYSIGTDEIITYLVQLNNVTVKASQHVRVLGVHFSSDLSLDKHVSMSARPAFIIFVNSDASGGRLTLIQRRHSFTPSWRRVSIIATQSSPRLRRQQQTGYNEC